MALRSDGIEMKKHYFFLAHSREAHWNRNLTGSESLETIVKISRELITHPMNPLHRDDINYVCHRLIVAIG